MRGDYAIPDLAHTTSILKGAPPPLVPVVSYGDQSPPPPAVPPHPNTTYSGAGEVGIQGLSGNSLYAVPNNLDLLWKDDFAVMEFARENLKFVEKLGEGQFGEVCRKTICSGIMEFIPPLLEAQVVI